MKKTLFIFSLALTFSASAQVCFNPQVMHPVVSNCNSIITADFNQDGKADVATVSGAANSVSVLFGDGFGGVYNLDSTVVDSLPYMLTSADFNNDGFPDIATANYTDKTISVMLNTGLGTFTSAVSYNAVIDFTTGYGPYAISTGDFNNDSDMDIVVANSTGLGSLSVLLGNGLGAFSAPVAFIVGNSPVSVISDDFNNDGFADLACSHYSPAKVSILLGDGTGNFSSPSFYSAGSNAQSLASADLDGDGNKDIAVANFGSNNVSVLLGTGTGGFSSTTNFSVGTKPFCIIIADFDNDNNKDIATADMLSSAVTVLLGNGTGNFSSAGSFGSGPIPHGLASADFNMDGEADIVVGNWQATAFSMLLSCLITDIRSNENTPAAVVYPNPSSGIFNIELNSFEGAFIELHDMHGKQILNKAASNTTTIDASLISSGVYVLTVKNNNGVSKQKLIVSK